MTEQVALWLQTLSPHEPAVVGLYLAVHVAFAMLFLPCSPLTAAAGLIWGLWPGLLISVSAALLSAAVTFGIGRRGRRLRMGAAQTRLRMPKRLATAVAVLTGAGWRSVVLFQGTPLIPGSSLGYVFGFTAIGFGEFMLASLVGMLPMQIVIVAGAALAYDMIVLNEMRQYAMWTMLLIAVGLGAAIVRRWRAQRESQARD